MGIKLEKKLIVYDFDGTLYRGDSTRDYIFYCISENKRILLSAWRMIPVLTGFLFHRDLARLKSGIFRILCRHFDLSREAERFWKDPETIARLYPDLIRHEPDRINIICSASPDFELAYPFRMLGADSLICTRWDEKKKQIIGSNCKSQEKIRRIREQYGNVPVEEMYTDDDVADGPLLSLAEKGFILKNGKIIRSLQAEHEQPQDVIIGV